MSAQIAQQEKLNAARARDTSGIKELSQAQSALKQLTQAQRNYIAAIKNGDQASQSYWKQAAQSASNEIRSIENKIGSLNLEEDVRRKLLNIIQQAKDAEQTHTRNLEQLNNGTTKLDESLNRVGTRLLRMAATMVVLRGLTALFRNATAYAQQYYDKLNEIRIVTGKSEAEANKLGAAYQKMAARMNVASTDIAKAAVEFWRQDLDETEVNRRLVAATQYAKISAIEFDEAAELVTAATNTMDISAQHVVDVFTYLGDASAAGASDIGKAMQKASASA